MKLNFISRISRILFLAFFLFSCSSDLDFDQVENLKLEPVFVANLAYFDVPANRLVDNGGNQIVYDTRDFDVFRNKFLTKHLKKAEFDVQIENTIDRAFAVNILLLSADGSVLETIPYVVPSYNGSTNIVKYPTQIFENQRLELLKQTVKLGFVVLVAAGPPLNQNSVGDLKLKSSGTVYLEIE
ncbi:hypothetical protein ACFFLS_06625 [Flavobacterium procerum]|uniref:DUF4843 domain-containing protein n=1 Tax=Flavobacterium procerum TaxID=1455569 RepID=A0ABV6BMN2_9FLAO